MYEYEIFSDRGLCVFVARGDIGIDELKSTGQRMLNDERWVQGGNFL